jgi:putative transcriptional regulator
MRNRVREQRRQRGLSQAELADALGVSRQTVISIESGRYLPSLPLAFAIARFFDLTVDKMFDPDEQATPGTLGIGAGSAGVRGGWVMRYPLRVSRTFSGSARLLLSQPRDRQEGVCGEPTTALAASIALSRRRSA